MSEVGASHVTGTRVGNALVVTLSRDLGGATMEHFTRVALEGVQQGGATVLVVDASGVPFMDGHEFHALRQVLRMAGVLGARTMLVGLQPGIIMHLMECDADVDGLHAMLGLDDALRSLGAEPETSGG